MYIKTKHIKYSLLIILSAFFAGFNYFSQVQANVLSGNTKICNKAVDSDCDDLTDAEEKLYGTEINNSDTDGDGYSDGVEVKSGYDPTKPAPGDKISNISNTVDKSITDEKVFSTPSLTADFASDFKDLIAAKNGEPLTNAEVNDFVSSKLASKMGSGIAIDSLPEIDQSKIKILNQSYPLLNAEQKKQQLQKDSADYFSNLFYLLISNSPREISSQEDLKAFNADFLERAATFATTNPDYAYFSDLGKRLELVISQLSEITVPETILPIHIKMIRIVKGFLLLKNDSISTEDPISQTALLSKIQALSTITADFLQYDITNYFNQL